jgi:hypothetical protein
VELEWIEQSAFAEFKEQENLDQFHPSLAKAILLF